MTSVRLPPSLPRTRTSPPTSGNTAGATRQQTVASKPPDKQVVLTLTSGGKPVRERYANGQEAVIAYDKTGKAHRFMDQRVTTLPLKEQVGTIPAWRRGQLDGLALGLIHRYGGGKPVNTRNGLKKPTLDFHDFGAMAKEIAGWKNLTEKEKVYTWSHICGLKGKPGLTGFPKSYYNIDLKGMNTAARDSEPLRGGNSPAHILIDLRWDDYHGDMGNMTPEQAERTIRDKESKSANIPLIGRVDYRNSGDYNASMLTADALRHMIRSGFSAYADAFNRNFVVR